MFMCNYYFKNLSFNDGRNCTKTPKVIALFSFYLDFHLITTPYFFWIHIVFLYFFFSLIFTQGTTHPTASCSNYTHCSFIIFFYSFFFSLQINHVFYSHLLSFFFHPLVSHSPSFNMYVSNLDSSYFITHLSNSSLSMCFLLIICVCVLIFSNILCVF